jgi:hypothetical protein
MIEAVAAITALCHFNDKRHMKSKKWDLFISYASEDKTDVARPLADALTRAGVRVWLDEHELKIGDSLSAKIDEGLSASRYGVVILSPAFLAKHWPKKELSGLRAKEEAGHKVILPIWHNVDKATIADFSPVLADALAANTADGIDRIAIQLVKVVFDKESDSPSAKYPSAARRLIELLESPPNDTGVVNFVRYNRERYMEWEFVPEKYELEGMEFDAYKPYCGHGMALWLYRFTKLWKDPFEVDPNEHNIPRISMELEQTIVRIRSVQRRFISNPSTQRRVFDSVVAYYPEMVQYAQGWLTSDQLVKEHVLRLEFVIFAGRRVSIDRTAARHDMWSRLRSDNEDLTIKSYDALVDVFNRPRR